MNRIRDWSELDPNAQRRRREAARAHAAALNPALNAFVEIVPPAPSGMVGPLNGLPYAAKDMFRTPTREPGCGFDPVLRSASKASAIRSHASRMPAQTWSDSPT